MKTLKTLHLASFDGNIGDNANHFGFYTYLKQNKNFKFKIDKLEIREFYWKKRFFDKKFVELVNSYDLLIVGGGNYFELWVEDSPTGTSIAIELDLLQQINTPILFNALGVDPGQGASEENINKFRKFLNLLIERDDFISIRNDGAKKAIIDHVGAEYLEHIIWTPDAGFAISLQKSKNFLGVDNYIAINIAGDMLQTRFPKSTNGITYENFIKNFAQTLVQVLEKNPQLQLVFVPHIFRDYQCIIDLLNILPDEIRRKKVIVAPLLHGMKSEKKFFSIYKYAKLSLSMRFHANVCSISYATPTIGLINYRQIKELYNELQNSKMSVEVNKLGFEKKLLNLINKILLDEKKYKKKYTNLLQENIHYINHYHKKINTWLISRKFHS